MAASDTLLERERELAELTELVDRAADGHGTVALIEGPAGIGKTRLLAEVRSAGAAVGARTLTARGSELEREFPFGAVRQLFEATVLEAGQDPFAGAAGPARAVFGTPEGQADASPDSAFAALHGLFWLVLNVTADRPLVLLIDDLHWCDRPSLRFFAYLVTPPGRRPAADGRDGPLHRAGHRSGAPGRDRRRSRHRLRAPRAAERGGRGHAGARTPGRRGRRRASARPATTPPTATRCC